jgi:HEAT repeat protein
VLSAGEIATLREAAAEAFAILRADADLAAPLLVRAIRNPAEAECIRRKALVALGKIGPNAAIAIPAAVESLEFDPSEAVRDEAARALVGIGGPAYRVLGEYLAHPQAAVRWRIAAVIAAIKSPPEDLLARLRDATSDPDGLVRMALLSRLEF